MTVTARFKVSRVTPFGKPEDDWTQAEVEMTPDYAQGANAEWASATPSGVFRLTIVRAVAELFKPGSKVAISMDITPAE